MAKQDLKLKLVVLIQASDTNTQRQNQVQSYMSLEEAQKSEGGKTGMTSGGRWRRKNADGQAKLEANFRLSYATLT